MQVEHWPITRIKMFANPPQIPEELICTAMQAIEQAGRLQNPIIVDSHEVIVRGRIRYEAALRLGLTEVPVAVIPDPIPTDPWDAIRRYDHEIPEPADWESEWKLIRLEDLKGLDFDLSALGLGNGKTNFGQNEKSPTVPQVQ